MEGVQVEKTAHERGETARERTPQPNVTSYGRLDWKHRAHEAGGLNDKSVGHRLHACDRVVGRQRAAPEMRTLRILHVTPYFTDAWAYGGIPRVVSALARGLARRGHNVTVCTTDARDDAGRLPAGETRTAAGVAVHVFPNFSNRLAYRLQLFLPLGLGPFLARHAAAFDVAHVHACRNMPGAIAARHLRRAGIPYALEPNGTAPIIERRFVAKRAFDAVWGGRVLAGAACLVAVSNAERRQLQELGVDPAKIRLIPNPIDLDEFRRPVERGNFRRRFNL